MHDPGVHTSQKLARYLALAKSNPALFLNPSDAGFSILLGNNDIRQAEEEMAHQLEQQQLPVEWAEVGVVYEDQYLFILRDAVRFPDGHLGTYVRIVNENAVPGVAVLPVHDDKVVVVRHFRHATRLWHIEIPRGFGTRGLSGEQNARRELEEEIGGAISRLIPLGRMHTNTGLNSECTQLYYAELQSVGEPELQEAIAESLHMALSEFECLVRDGEITDSFTIAAYSRAKLRRLL